MTTKPPKQSKPTRTSNLRKKTVEGLRLPDLSKEKDEDAQTFIRSAGSFSIEIIKVILIALAIIIPVRYFLIQPFYVKGASMEPNFTDNEYLIINEISYRFNDPERGDIVVFRYPNNPSQFFIKRIIGLPGERVEIAGGRVKVYNADNASGVWLDESAYLPEDVRTSSDVSITLGADEFYVLGDNRPSSLDSRRFGPVQRRFIVGKTWLRAWPLSRLNIFDTPEYNLK